MDVRRILDSMSFAALDEEGQRVVREYAALYLKCPDDKLPEIELVDVLKQQQSLPVSVNLYAKRLARTHPMSLSYLTENKKLMLEQDLLFSFFIFSAQYQLDKAQGHEDKKRMAQIKKCATLLGELHLTPALDKKKSSEVALLKQVDASEKHVKYLGLTVVAPFIAENINGLTKERGAQVEKVFNDLNQKRRYWIWGGGLLTRVFESLSNNFYRTDQAQKSSVENNMVMSYINWAVLYARWGLNITVMGHHVLLGMTEEERKISRSDRFWSQLKKRQYVLIQDSLSITVGLMCAFWAVAGGPMSTLAGPLSVLLRVLSLMVTMRQYTSEREEHVHRLARFDRDLDLIEDRRLALEEEKQSLLQAIASLGTQDGLRGDTLNQLDMGQQIKLIHARKQLGNYRADVERIEMSLLVLDGQVTMLRKAKQKYRADWHSQENALFLDLGLSTGLLAGVCLMSSVFFPPVAIIPVAITILNVTGAAVCFGSAITFSVFKERAKLTKSGTSEKSFKEEHQLLLTQFLACKDEDQKILLYLDIKSLRARAEFQRELIVYQKMKAIYSVTIQALLPAVIFVTFIFMPPAGIALLGIGFIIAMAADNYLHQHYKPKGFEETAFDEADYKAFQRNPTLESGSVLPNKEFAGKRYVEQRDVDSDSLDEVDIFNDMGHVDSGGGGHN